MKNPYTNVRNKPTNHGPSKWKDSIPWYLLYGTGYVFLVHLAVAYNVGPQDSVPLVYNYNFAFGFIVVISPQ